MAGKTSAATCLLVLLAACAAHRHKAPAPEAEEGSLQFRNYCAGCHQGDGEGGVEAPPLAGSPWVTGPESRLIRIVLHGVRGPMEVRGTSYDREMPGFGQVMPDADVAALLTYVRKRFGARGGPVSLDAVSEVRAANQKRTEYWRVEELLK